MAIPKLTAISIKTKGMVNMGDLQKLVKKKMKQLTE